MAKAGNWEIVEALEQIARDRSVDLSLVVETLKLGLLSAAKKRFGSADHIEVEVDPKAGRIEMYARRRVVEGTPQSPAEISLEHALRIDPEAQVGGEVLEPLDFADFGRNAILMTKQILVQRIREAEREQLYGDFQKRIGEIVSGKVQRVERGEVIVNLGRTEGIMPVSEQVRRERYHQGDQIRAYILDVRKTPKGPQVILSRSHPNFLKKLFYIEVPEVYDGIVQIRAVAREAGERAKVAVSSTDPNVDPVGACVGMKGVRIQAIVRELGNERIDVIPWSDDPKELLAHALAPASVRRVEAFPEEGRLVAVVPEDQISLAIGRSGQNARLAAALLPGWKVDILTEEGFYRKQQLRELLEEALREIGEGDLIPELKRHGLFSPELLAATEPGRLEEALGIDRERAEALIARVRALMEGPEEE